MAKNNMKTIFVINLCFSAISSVYTARTVLSNGDIIEIETLNTGYGMGNYGRPNYGTGNRGNAALNGGLEQILQAVGGKEPVTIEFITDEQGRMPYGGQQKYNYNNYNNQYGQRPMHWRPPTPPDGYGQGQYPAPGWNPQQTHQSHQYPPNYNPYNRPVNNQYQNGLRPNQGQQIGNSPYVITKQPANPNYPNFEVYTVDVQNPNNNNPYTNNNNNNPYSNNNNNNKYPSGNDNHQNPYYNNNNNNNNDRYPNNEENLNPHKHDPQPTDDPNTDDPSKIQNKGDNSNEENNSENTQKDKVDGYLDKFPVILLNENEIRRR